MKLFKKGHKWEGEEFSRNGCPFCGNSEYIEGPSGGLSVNFICNRCSAKFNAMGPFGVELLEGPSSILYSGNFDFEEKNKG